METELTLAPVQYTNKGHRNKNEHRHKQTTESELTIGDGSYYSRRAPLSVDITSAMTGLKTFEEERQVELDPCLRTLLQEKSRVVDHKNGSHFLKAR